jgi:hypothetical protein
MSEPIPYLFNDEHIAFERHAKWNTDLGNFVLISGAAILGPYKNRGEAITIGCEVYVSGAKFMVKAIVEVESIQTYYRNPNQINNNRSSRPHTIEAPKYL